MTNDALKEAIDGMKYIWIHRKGNEVPAAVQDVIAAHWQKENLIPLIVKKQKRPNSWTMIIYLPAGIGYADFKAKESLFADATGGAVIIEKHKKGAVMQVLTERLKECYLYEWNWQRFDMMALPVPFGYSAAGMIVRDLADAPNLLVAGHPGAGKSNFLHVLVVSLILSRQIQLVVIDLKQLEFAYLEKKTLLITEIEQAREVLIAINKQLDKRLQLLKRAKVVKIQDYQESLPFIVLIVDELAELQDEVCQTALNRILRLGRAAGICVVCATQRPSSSMFAKFGDSKAMFAASMCFRVRDEVNSRMVLDNGRAALIPNIKGRAIYQWDMELEVQSMYLPVKQARKLLAESLNELEVMPYEQPCKRLPPR